MNFRLIRLALFTFLLLVPASLVQADLAPGAAAPDFELTDMEGRKVRLSDYKGQPFILKLATTWCPSCKQQSDQFASASKFLTENNIPIVEVFVDDTEEEVKNYIKKHPLPGEASRSILDDGTVYKKYNVYLIPRVLVVDKEFRVHRDGSVIDASALQLVLKKLL